MNSRFPLSAANMVTLALALYRRDFERNLGLMLRGWSMLLKPKHSASYFQAIAVLITQELEGQEPEATRLESVLDEWVVRYELLKKSLRCALRPTLSAYVVLMVVLFAPLLFVPLLTQAHLIDGGISFRILLGAIAILSISAIIAFATFVTWIQLRTTCIVPLVVFFEEHTTPLAVVKRCRRLTRGHARRLASMNLLSSLVIWPLRLLPLLAYWVVLRTVQWASVWGVMTFLAIAVAILVNSIVMTPFAQILQAIAYHDLRVRSEGIDLRFTNSQIQQIRK